MVAALQERSDLESGGRKYGADRRKRESMYG